MKTQFLNRFQKDIDKSKLSNLVSGCPVDDAISDSLLSLHDDGVQSMRSFETPLTTQKPAEMFYGKLKRNKFKSWKDTYKKTGAKKDGKAKELMFQRDIFGNLVAHSCQ